MSQTQTIETLEISNVNGKKRVIVNGEELILKDIISMEININPISCEIKTIRVSTYKF